MSQENLQSDKSVEMQEEQDQEQENYERLDHSLEELQNLRNSQLNISSKQILCEDEKLMDDFLLKILDLYVSQEQGFEQFLVQDDQGQKKRKIFWQVFFQEVKKWGLFNENQIRNIFELIDFDNDNEISSNEWDYVFSRFELKKELEKSLLNNSESKRLEKRKKDLMSAFDNSPEKREIDNFIQNIQLQPSSAKKNKYLNIAVSLKNCSTFDQLVAKYNSDLINYQKKKDFSSPYLATEEEQVLEKTLSKLNQNALFNNISNFVTSKNAKKLKPEQNFHTKNQNSIKNNKFQLFELQSQNKVKLLNQSPLPENNENSKNLSQTRTFQSIYQDTQNLKQKKQFILKSPEAQKKSYLSELENFFPKTIRSNQSPVKSPLRNNLINIPKKTNLTPKSTKYLQTNFNLNQNPFQNSKNNFYSNNNDNLNNNNLFRLDGILDKIENQKKNLASRTEMLNKAKSPEKFVSPLRNFVNDDKKFIDLKKQVSSLGFRR